MKVAAKEGSRAQAKITVLVENTARGPGILAEHGLAVWIEYGDQRVLFDTGQGVVLAANAKKLGLRLTQVDAVVLSHGHYDHTGGLPEVIHQNTRVKLFAHPDAFAPKYSQHAGRRTVRDVGLTESTQLALHRLRNPLVATEKPTEIFPGLFATGEVPRTVDFEADPETFFLDDGCTDHDPLRDDQALYFDSPEGTVVLLGCAHAGVINTLKYIDSLTNHRPLHAVFGGMHLINASRDRIKATVRELKRFEPAIIGPAHCTGDAATGAIWCAMPDQCVGYHVGSKFEFELSGRNHGGPNDLPRLEPTLQPLNRER
ncbi:MBL fold metallo-hydrolase [Novipirellula artificiosorum]|uniref:Ribonuclease Z n=1 Tax=Novipirellula artificiosorum TaxID=2528016 RepID=A0A5C6DXJ5_9BACT|nr:MBL fold metallo-hydrolase [Novipirellula artificiosorum]TWU40954.1 ribonuclease Z [Novipirellula artificiosorum]